VHLTSYTFQWLKQESKETISKQAVILFLTGLYYGEEVCDVLPMDDRTIWSMMGMQIDMHSSMGT